MYEYLVLPDDILFERLGEAGLLGTTYDKLAQHDYSEKLDATTSRLTDLLQKADEDVAETAATDTKKAIDGIESISGDTDDASTKSSDQRNHPDQVSLNQVGGADETATDSEDKQLSVGPFSAVWKPFNARLRREWELLKSAPNAEIPAELNRDVLTRLTVVSLSIVGYGLFMGWSGVSQGLLTGNLSYIVPWAIGVVIMLPWVIWRTTEDYRPPDVEHETAFDQLIMGVHITMDPIMQRVP
jgi:hypothetical protein